MNGLWRISLMHALAFAITAWQHITQENKYSSIEKTFL